MLKQSILSTLAATLTIGIVANAPKADAALLNIANAGFEDPVLASGEFTQNILPGWNAYDPNGVYSGNSGYGVFNPTSTGAYLGGVPEGNNDAYVYVVDNSVAGISQTLSDVLTANTQYTLTVDVGNPAPYTGYPELAGFPGHAVQLLAGGNVIAQEASQIISQGTFATSTLTYTATAGDALLGQPLEIRLLNTVGNTGVEVDFDNVRLEAISATTVPEPTSMLGILAFGAFGAGSILKKKIY
jgi:hypothetical protein